MANNPTAVTRKDAERVKLLKKTQDLAAAATANRETIVQLRVPPKDKAPHANCSCSCSG
jgi:hypothetical protein